MSVMQFSFWKYALTPKARIGAVAGKREREGSLIRVQWPDGFVGYSDLFPWPEFGDRLLDEQLRDLRMGRISPGIEQSVWLARRDANARHEGVNLMKNLPRLKNHLLITDPKEVTEADLGDAKKVGYQSVKLKCGHNLDEELEMSLKLMKRGFMLRLDFNSRSTPADMNHFLDKIPEALRGKIEFIEDPFPFEANLWRSINMRVPLALDQESTRVAWSQMNSAQAPPFKVMVVKPARQDTVKAIDVAHKFRLKIVITSSLDHPVGQMHAGALSGEFKKLYPNMILDSGCFSHRQYEQDMFSQLMPAKGPYLSEVPGDGVGFDSLLLALPWTNLKDL